MPHSYNDFRDNVVSFLVSRLPGVEARVLDLGAGDGAFGSLIRRRFPNTDAVEIWAPYVERFGLHEKYRHVFVMPADELPLEEISDSAIVIGDMLEHLTVAGARRLIENLSVANSKLSALIVQIVHVLPHGFPLLRCPACESGCIYLFISLRRSPNSCCQVVLVPSLPSRCCSSISC